MSYEEVSKLIERQTGEKLLSDQKVWDVVVEKAIEVSKQIVEEVESVPKEIQIPAINQEVDIYSSEQTEVLIFYDAIQVKEQKETREPANGAEDAASDIEEIGKGKRENSWVSTDVAMLEKANGGFQYLTAGIDEKGNELISLEEVVIASIKQEYGNIETPMVGQEKASKKPLNIVAITDGARSIRCSLMVIFGFIITIILDWYHLEKKVGELMSMIARNKKEKEEHLNFIFHHLWRGRTDQVQQYLKTEVKAKNPEKLKELTGYLEKHQGEIIDYELRQKAGKTIGSGRMEKGVDQVIGHRQKKKGMSWRQKGSKSLAILKTVELNKKWNDLWFPEQIAA